MTLQLGSHKSLLYSGITPDLFRATFSQDLATLPETLYRSNAPATITPTLGAELATGTLTVGTWYSITATEVDHFYTSCAIGQTFRATATTALDANNKVKAITAATLLASVQTLAQCDYIAQVGCNVVAGAQIGLVFALDDATTPLNFILAYVDGVNAHLVKCVAGVYAAESINAAHTDVPGAMLKVVKTGTSVELWYNGAQVGTTQTISDAGIIGNLKVGLFSTYVGNFFTQPFLIQKPNVIPCDIGSLVATDTYNVTGLIVNGGFETVTAAGPPANFGTWGETASDGNIEVETTILHSGATACKLTAGAGVNTNVYQAFVVIPGLIYSLNLWSAGDGTHAGQYRIRDLTNAADLVPGVVASTGITAVTYGNVQYSFTAPAGCISVQVYCYCPAVNGAYALFDDISVKPVSPLLSVTNGRLVVSGGKSTPTWGDPRVGGPAIARKSGRTALFTFTMFGVAKDAMFGFDSDLVSILDEAALYPRGTGAFAAYGGGQVPAIFTYSLSTEYTGAVILLSTGQALFLVKGGTADRWTLLWKTPFGSATSVYPGISVYNAAFTADNLRVFDLPGFSDFALCQARVASPASPAPTVGPGELVINGTFGADTDWTKDLLWTISGNVLNAALVAINSSTVSNAAVFAANTWYRWAFDKTGTDSFALQDGTTTIYSTTAAGTFTGTYRSAAGGAARIKALADLKSGTFDNVSAKAIALASMLGTPQGIGTTDFLAEVNPTITANTQAGLMLAIDDIANPQNFILAYHDGTNFHAVKCVGGAYAAESINVAATYAAGGRIVAIKDGTAWSFFYNNVLMTGSPVTISDAGIVSNKTHTWWSTYSGNTFSEFQLWPRHPDRLGGV